MSYYIPSRTYSRFSPIYHQQTPPAPTEYVPFTVKVLNPGTNVQLFYGAGEPSDNTFYYKLGDGEWTPYTVNTDIQVEDTISFSGTTSVLTQNTSSNYYKLVTNGDYIVSGNLDSLVNHQNTIPSYSFYGFFNDPSTNNYTNYYLVDASNLIIPSGTFGDHVLERLFYRCENLTAGPALPAITLSGQTYRNMFAECHNLLSVGAISAEIVAYASMQYMFYNCTSLIEIPQFRPRSVDQYGCKQMFDKCSNLTSLNLQWDQLSSVQYHSFDTTFSNCTSLVSVSGSIGTSDMTFNGSENFLGLFRYDSALVDATHLTMNPLDITGGGTAYGRLFRQCTSLTGAPNLPATGFFCQLAYNTMFYGCTSLKDAPYLPAQTPFLNCYNSMFNGCSSLTSINVALTSWVDSNGNAFGSNWVNGVAAEGTFTKPSTLSEEYGANRIPNGWTVVDI